MEKADITAIFAKSGSGKSHLMQRITARDQRLLVVDYKGEYKGQRITSIAELGEALRRTRFRLAFVPSRDKDIRDRQFNRLCYMAYAVGNLRLVVDEARIYTKPSWAPAGWAECTTMGRDRDLRIIAASQRPQHVDKEIIENCSRMFVGFLNTKNAIDAVEDQIGTGAYARHAPIPKWSFLHWSDDDPSNVTLLRP